MPENDKIGREEENFGLHCVQYGQKDEKNKSETFQETSVECSNGSDQRLAKTTSFFEWAEESRKSNPHSFRLKNFHRWFCPQQEEGSDSKIWEW